MKVILKQDVNKIGKKGDLLEVADGYGRNFLIARGLAEEATDSRVKELYQMQKTQKVKDDKTIDLFNDMTDKQLDMFSDKLSRLESFQNHFRAYVGEDLKDYAIRIREKLKDNFYVQEWFKYLEQVGYVATKLSK